MLDEENSDHQKSNAKIIHSIVEAVDRSNYSPAGAPGKSEAWRKKIHYFRCIRSGVPTY